MCLSHKQKLDAAMTLRSSRRRAAAAEVWLHTTQASTWPQTKLNYHKSTERRGKSELAGVWLFNTNVSFNLDRVNFCLVVTWMCPFSYSFSYFQPSCWSGQPEPPVARAVFPFFPQPDLPLQNQHSPITEWAEVIIITHPLLCVCVCVF